MWCCARDEGLLALRCRPAGDGIKPPHAALVDDRRGVVNMNVGGESSEMAVSLMAVLYEEMEVVWPSGVALRGVASNGPPGLWLKAVVLNGVGKGVI